jgi:hypothetical protein
LIDTIKFISQQLIVAPLEPVPVNVTSIIIVTIKCI